MGKRLSMFLACVLALAFVVPVYAEVQNIKVGGDILTYGISRHNFNLKKGAVGNQSEDSQSFAQSAVRLKIESDLTENVGTVVQLVNEREWSEEDSASTDIDLDLAYVKFKEFLYSPLTVVLGRQNLRYGNGFIIGDPDTNQYSKFGYNTTSPTIITRAQDLSVRKAFDAVKAVLNYDPLVVDLIYAKIDENTTLGATGSPENDDLNLYGMNAAYNFGTDKNIASDLYLFVKDSGSDSTSPSGTIINKDDEVITVGAKTSLNPIEKMYLSGELAYQFGDKFIPAGTGVNQRTLQRKALAYQFMGNYAFGTKYSPVLTGAFTHYDGNKDTNSSEEKTYRGWDPMFEDQAGGKIYNALFPATNCNTAEVKLAVTPIEDVVLSLEYAHLFLDKSFEAGFTLWPANGYAGSGYTVIPGKTQLADEIDLVATYNYTEDVQFGLNFGYLKAGNVFDRSNRTDATQVVGSVKVAF